jgi:peptidyl-prolyl cis-trans isomerase SurA
MISIKKIFSIIMLLVISVEISNAAIKDSLFATIGHKAVTQSDVLNEIKLILILNGESFTEDKKKELQSAAVNSIIMKNIKKIEIEKYNLEYNNADLLKELENLSSNLNIDLNTLRNILINNEIDFELLAERIRVELLWNSLIFSLYNKKLLINLDEINEQLKQYQGKKDVEEFLISEIIIKSVNKDKIETTVQELKDKIEIEGFEKVAIDNSISETSTQGGDLGWVTENVISEELKSKIINTKIGNISEPIFLPTGILFFKLRDRRIVKKEMDLDQIKDLLVKAEKNKILNMYSLSHYDSVKRTVTIDYY